MQKEGDCESTVIEFKFTSTRRINDRSTIRIFIARLLTKTESSNTRLGNRFLHKKCPSRRNLNYRPTQIASSGLISEFIHEPVRPRRYSKNVCPWLWSLALFELWIFSLIFSCFWSSRWMAFASSGRSTARTLLSNFSAADSRASSANWRASWPPSRGPADSSENSLSTCTWTRCCLGGPSGCLCAPGTGGKSPQSRCERGTRAFSQSQRDPPST